MNLLQWIGNVEAWSSSYEKSTEGQISNLKSVGTSEGAEKGWDTRGRKGPKLKTRSTSKDPLYSSPRDTTIIKKDTHMGYPFEVFHNPGYGAGFGNDKHQISYNSAKDAEKGARDHIAMAVREGWKGYTGKKQEDDSHALDSLRPKGPKWRSKSHW